MEHQCVQETRINALEKQGAKAEVYFETIKSDIADINKKLDKPQSQQAPAQAASIWQPVILEIIKLVTMIVVILGALAGAAPIIEKMITGR